jgi:hypothetical protein
MLQYLPRYTPSEALSRKIINLIKMQREAVRNNKSTAQSYKSFNPANPDSTDTAWAT